MRTEGALAQSNPISVAKAGLDFSTEGREGASNIRLMPASHFTDVTRFAIERFTSVAIFAIDSMTRRDDLVFATFRSRLTERLLKH